MARAAVQHRKSSRRRERKRGAVVEGREGAAGSLHQLPASTAAGPSTPTAGCEATRSSLRSHGPEQAWGRGYEARVRGLIEFLLVLEKLENQHPPPLPLPLLGHAPIKSGRKNWRNNGLRQPAPGHLSLRPRCERACDQTSPGDCEIFYLQYVARIGSCWRRGLSQAPATR